MKPTNTVAKLFSSVSTLAVVAGAMACNSVAWGQASVLAWGAGTTITSNYPEYGQSIVPTAATDGVSAIAGGANHTIALKDGSVVAWGDNSSGQCTIPAAANSGVTAIASGQYHTIALKGGSVVAWGLNNKGQCLGTDSEGFAINTTANGAFVRIRGLTLSGVTAIAGGGEHTIALKDGSVVAWGYKNYGQINIPAAAQSGVNAIAGGYNHTIALKGGSVIAWGDNSSGQCLGTDSSGSPITAVAMGSSVQILGVTLSGVTAIAGGFNHTIALKDGSVVAWGDNSNGQCTIPIAAQSGVTAIAGGGFHTIALKDGRVLAWGYNWYGQLNIPTDALSGVIAIEGGYYHTIALKYIDSNDIDADGIPNASDNCPSVTNPTQSDCDGNGVGDACELDCNHNGIADVCEILSGVVTDQNLNGIPDTCEFSSVSRVLPISGPSTGGTAVRIIGTNFFSALPVSVTFGGAPATDVVVVSLTEITAVTPSGSPGDTFVAVNGAGAEEFYYRPSCDGDLDNNGTIDSADLGVMLTNYGNCYESAAAAPQEPMIFPIEAAKPVAVKK